MGDKIVTSERSEDPLLNKIESIIAQLELCESDLKSYAKVLSERMKVLKNLHKVITARGRVTEAEREELRRLIEHKALVKK